MILRIQAAIFLSAAAADRLVLAGGLPAVMPCRQLLPCQYREFCRILCRIGQGLAALGVPGVLVSGAVGNQQIQHGTLGKVGCIIGCRCHNLAFAGIVVCSDALFCCAVQIIAVLYFAAIVLIIVIIPIDITRNRSIFAFTACSANSTHIITGFHFPSMMSCHTACMTVTRYFTQIITILYASCFRGFSCDTADIVITAHLTGIITTFNDSTVIDISYDTTDIVIAAHGTGIAAISDDNIIIDNTCNTTDIIVVTGNRACIVTILDNCIVIGISYDAADISVSTDLTRIIAITDDNAIIALSHNTANIIITFYRAFTPAA